MEVTVVQLEHSSSDDDHGFQSLQFFRSRLKQFTCEEGADVIQALVVGLARRFEVLLEVLRIVR